MKICFFAKISVLHVCDNPNFRGNKKILPKSLKWKHKNLATFLHGNRIFAKKVKMIFSKLRQFGNLGMVFTLFWKKIAKMKNLLTGCNVNVQI
jgi:hypothetical protein